MVNIGISYDRASARHTYPGHPENAARLAAVLAAIERNFPADAFKLLPPQPVDDALLAQVHNPAYLETMAGIKGSGVMHLDPDTYVTPASWEIARNAAGCAVAAVDAVLNGRVANAFALPRPPGHHATRNRGMGFCLINNIAVAAHYALEQYGLSRIAIMDYDVHHGNGTQDIFEAEPRLFFCSTHAAPFYPGTGAVNEIGKGAAKGTTMNIPLPIGSGDRTYRKVFSELVIPALQAWKPELLLVSAGYDTHWNDPVGPMTLSLAGIAELSRMLVGAAQELCNGKIVFVLEGGYNLDALGAAVVDVLHLLRNEPPEPDNLGRVDAYEPPVGQLIDWLREKHPLFNG